MLKRGPGEGWVVFAGVVLMLAGAFNVIDGLVALTKDEYFRDELPLRRRRDLGRRGPRDRPGADRGGSRRARPRHPGDPARILFVFANSLVQLAWFAHFPLWSGAILVLNLFLLYALLVPATAED